jgi:hypothetical protein
MKGKVEPTVEGLLELLKEIQFHPRTAAPIHEPFCVCCGELKSAGCAEDCAVKGWVGCES